MISENFLEKSPSDDIMKLDDLKSIDDIVETKKDQLSSNGNSPSLKINDQFSHGQVKSQSLSPK